MAMTCTICRHIEREAIEDQLRRGCVLDRIVEQIETGPGGPISKSALFRHKENCLPFNLTTAGALSVIPGGPGPDPGHDDPLTRIEKLLHRLERMLAKVEEPGKASLFYQGSREIVRAAELLERLKTHYGSQYRTEQERRSREEVSTMEPLFTDRAFMEQVQEALLEAEERLQLV